MADGHGGARVGAGKKKKPLADNLLDGNPGKRALKVVSFNSPAELQGAEVPEHSDFLKSPQKEGMPDLRTSFVYKHISKYGSVPPKENANISSCRS